MFQPEPIRLALVGAGRWGSLLARAFGVQPNTSIVAICDPAPSRGAEGLPRYASLAELLARQDFDAVVIAAPSAAHADLALRSLRAGKAVFVEKPMATSVHDAISVCKEAVFARRILRVGHILEHHTCVWHLRRLIESGRLGALRAIHCVRHSVASSAPEEDVWWGLAPHDISLIRFLLRGEVEIVKATRTSAQSVAAELRTSAGVEATISVARGAAGKVRQCLVVGTAGIALFDDTRPDDALRVWATDRRNVDPLACVSEQLGRPSSSFERGPEPLNRQAESFVAALRGRREIAGDGWAGAAVVAALAAGEESQRRAGRPTRVPSLELPAPQRAAIEVRYE